MRRNRILAGVMFGAFVVFALFVLCGCAGTARYVKPPDVAPVRQSVNEGRSAVEANQKRIASARVSIGAAQNGAAELLRVAPVDLRPQVVTLRKHLATAETELVEANLRADAALVKLREADERTIHLGAEVDRLAIAHAKTSDKLEQKTAEANTQRKLAWKWRGIAGAVVLLVAGLYFARMQFPFLKILIP